MPRQKSSGRSGGSSRRPTPPVQRPLPPPPPLLPQQQTGGGSMMAGMAGTIAQGVAFGTGSAVAHRAVDAVMGPRAIQHEHVQLFQEQCKVSPLCSSQLDLWVLHKDIPMVQLF
ncbi:hypothetical protein CY35_19G038300 [Sphagnum magellanicum]|nr:hypothetical protein CY35_19G038300 [Sphagnum magellanicum]